MNLQLSEAASAAIGAKGPILVLGGPGSGKTTLSLLKAKSLTPTLKPGQSVLFLSFSRAAVRQVILRCQDTLSADERRLISVKTYHAFCLDVLKAHGRLLSGTPPRILFPGDERLAKARFDGDWGVERARLAADEGVYAFDLFAECCADLLTRSRCVRQLIGQQYPVIILDEFQDTDDAQWNLVKLLSQESLLITLADPDQRIFEYDDSVNPKRLDQLRSFLGPAEFNLGGANHRSPHAQILNFADAILHGSPLPQTNDVKVVYLYPNVIDAAVHAYVVWMLAALRKAGIPYPTVAVLCRTNSLVAEMSGTLSTPHTYSGQRFAPLGHHVVWDAELTATAAQVVASILEWSHSNEPARVAATLLAIARYFDLKNAERSTASARENAARYRVAAAMVADGRPPRPHAAKELVEAFKLGLELKGDPVADWMRARDILARISQLTDVFSSVRFVRLFRATDEIGSRLAQQWDTSGTYTRAAEIVKRALDAQHIASNQMEPGGILLMTMHKSKGKEFDGVVLVERQYSGKFFDDRREPYDASRRLLRVGITRARHKVAIVRPVGALPLTPS